MSSEAFSKKHDNLTMQVLVGEYEQPEHSRVPILKTTDFGLATRALPSHEQNPHYIYALRRRGTLGWLTPVSFAHTTGLCTH